jgi:orotidine-5'-phosphate decarboxylase
VPPSAASPPGKTGGEPPPSAGRQARDPDPGIEPFGDRLARRVAERESQIVLGLDPDPDRLWPAAVDAGQVAEGSAAERAARSVLAHCRAVIEAVAGQCVAVKPQVACFERLGAPGWAALAEVVNLAKDHGLLVICDGKRGDIDVTARAYAQSYFGSMPTPFGEVASLGADALTVNPLLGMDTIQPLADAARTGGGGLFLLVRTSNPGAADLQDLILAAGGTVSGRLAEFVAALGLIGSHGLADIGAVVGATVPEQLSPLREAMPQAPFLLPGVGAQGGRVEELAAAFAPGPGGGLISASRGIVAAHERLGGDPAAAAREEAARLRELAWKLVS